MTKRIQIDWRRAGTAIAMAGALTFLQVGPAYAFDVAANQVSAEVCQAYNAAKAVLTTAAVLALIIGMAPMLWGQVKVKWIISALVGCMCFGLTSTIISAFAQSGNTCG